MWEELVAGAATADFARRVEYVEQPLPRHLALSEETAAGLAAWPGRPRLIIDESDDSLDAVARALEAGYEGGAFKSSKGVFKGIGNACRIEQLRQESPAKGLIYSAEDLSTIGPVGLLADLAVIATLGIDEPERNGYHYLRNDPGLPARVDEETLRHHGDLFAADADGRAVLDIRDGTVDVGSVVRPRSASAGAATSRTSSTASARSSRLSRRGRIASRLGQGRRLRLRRGRISIRLDRVGGCDSVGATSASGRKRAAPQYGGSRPDSMG